MKWIFLVDTLNFCFWFKDPSSRFVVNYKNEDFSGLIFFDFSKFKKQKEKDRSLKKEEIIWQTWFVCLLTFSKKKVIGPCAQQSIEQLMRVLI